MGGSQALWGPGLWGHLSYGESQATGAPKPWASGSQPMGPLSHGETRAAEAPEGQHRALEELGGERRAGWGWAAGAAACPSATPHCGCAQLAGTLTLAPAGLSGPSQQQQLCKLWPWRAEECLPDQPLQKPLPGPPVQSTNTCPTSLTPSSTGASEPRLEADGIRCWRSRSRMRPWAGLPVLVLGQGGQGHRDGAHSRVTGGQPRP